MDKSGDVPQLVHMIRRRITALEIAAMDIGDASTPDAFIQVQNEATAICGIIDRIVVLCETKARDHGFA